MAGAGAAAVAVAVEVVVVVVDPVAMTPGSLRTDFLNSGTAADTESQTGKIVVGYLEVPSQTGCWILIGWSCREAERTVCGCCWSRQRRRRLGAPGTAVVGARLQVAPLCRCVWSPSRT